MASPPNPSQPGQFFHPSSPKNLVRAEQSPKPSTGYQPQWRQAGRAKRWQPFRPVNLIGFRLVQIGTAIALFLEIRIILKLFMTTANEILVKVYWHIQLFYRDPTWFVLLTLLALLCLSPWLIDGLLSFFYGLKPLTISKLANQSPESARVLQRFCRQRHLPLPTLRILPAEAPSALTYGWLPRNAHIVVTQGLLDQLADDEIATIYAGEMGHIGHWDFAVMSLAVLVTQIPYTIYWQTAQWGDHRQNPLLRQSAAGIAAIAYGLYWLLRWPALWLSRLRIYYSDRLATEITGNPNGLTRALLKIAVGIAKDVQRQGHTSYLLEGFELLTPVGHRTAISLGSSYSYTSLESVLEWDCNNPHRRWLVLNNSHPLAGDRLRLLALYARHWKLETELDWRNLTKPFHSVIASDLKQHWQRLLLQGAPFFGILIGLAAGGVLWLIGGVGKIMGIAQLASLFGDRWIVASCLPIGFGIGTFIRINSFFPDIKLTTIRSEPSLSDLLSNPSTLPLNSQPIRLQGKLLGRCGISNWLGQDLILQTTTGLVKLHYVSQLGPIGNLWSQSTRLSSFVAQPVSVTGWFRRGATPWLDVEMLRTQGGRMRPSGHPSWSTILASGTTAWGVYIIYRGGL